LHFRFIGQRSGANQQVSLDSIEALVGMKQKAFAGVGDLISKSCMTVNRQDPSRSVAQSVGSRVNQREVWLVSQNRIACGVNSLIEARGIGAAARDGDTIVEVQLTGTAVVVEPIGDIRILLQLEQGQAAADGMDGSRRHQEEIAAGCRTPIDQLLDLSIEGGEPQFLPGYLTPKAEPDDRAGFGIEHVPTFRLAARHSAGTSLLIVRMDLNRQWFTGKQVFRKQRQIIINKP
jgi:hypothetical protein